MIELRTKIDMLKSLKQDSLTSEKIEKLESKLQALCDESD